MNKQTNTPELRFPEFDEEWEKRKLGEVVNYKNGGSFESLVKNHGVYKLITLKSVNTEGKLCNSGKYIDDKCVETLCNDTLVMILSEQAPGLVGMTAIIPNNNEYVLNQRVAALVPKQFIDSQFLSKLINRNQKYFSVRSAGTKVKNISKGHVENFNFLSPDYTEQQKIGNFFSKLDRQIELEEKKLELFEQQKRGYMQKIFSQELRFKDDKGINYPEWRYNYLGDYLILHDEKTTENNQYPVLTSSREGLFLQKDYFTRDVASKDNTGYNVVPYGYFTYRHMSDDLIFKFNINYIVQKGIVSTLYPVFKTTNDLDNYFLKEILNNGNEFKKYALMQKQGGSRTYMYFSKLKKLKLHIPVLEEQQKIGDFFSKLDSSIEKQSAKVELLKKRKQAFLQKMFV